MAAREVIQRKERKDDNAVRVHEPRKWTACVLYEQERECRNDRQQLWNLRVKPGRIRTQQEQYKFNGNEYRDVNLVSSRKRFEVV